MSVNSALRIVDNLAEWSIEQLLTDLCKYGRPRVTKSENGWYAGIEVFVTGEGVSFKVNDYRAVSAHQALLNVHIKLAEAMQKINESGAK